jgi:protoporphyrinogen oxidase
VGSLSDKLLIYKLTRQLKRKSIEDIFAGPSTSTIQYLKAYGFGERMIGNFFAPFFGGIYLENELRTSSRMFEFVFKMFGEGYAAVPAEGMEEIPKQLFSALNSTRLLTNTEVTSLSAGDITLSSGEIMPYDKLIIASPPNKLLEGFREDFHEFEAVTNLYFKTTERGSRKPLIALVPGDESVINNFTVITDVAPAYSSGGESLISVSVNGYADSEVQGMVKNELAFLGGFNAEKLEHIKSYELAKALPRIEDQAYSMPLTEVKVQDNIFLAGDYLLNASLNAAMVSGRTAAEAVLAG